MPQSDGLKTKYGSKMVDIMYHINGTGRDTYIYQDNGGFAEMHRNGNRGSQPGRFLPKVKASSPQRHPNLAEQAMPKRYLTDGTGRDGYIFANDGGMTSSGKFIVMDPRIVF